MFAYENGIYTSSLLREKGIGHGFSTRNGGVSALAHTSAMNLGFGRGDSDETVFENLKIFKALSGINAQNVAFAPQIHSTIVRKITTAGFTSPLEKCDGFITDLKGVALLIRVADCVPILFYGEGVISAVHAGWRGTVGGICQKAVDAFLEYGVKSKDITASIGHCIHSCCFEVKEDFVEVVKKERGADFVDRHIKYRDNKFYADLVEMNVEILKHAGVFNIDVSHKCTACDPLLFHSHRKSGGKRGTMGAIISL